MTRHPSSRTKHTPLLRGLVTGAIALSLTAVGIQSAGIAAQAADAYFAPVAENDFYSMVQGSTMNVFPASGLLVNDHAADPGDLKVEEFHNWIVAELIQPSNDGSFAYTPDPAFVGTRTFQYRVIDSESHLVSDWATVTIEVTAIPEPENQAPVAVDDAYSMVQGTALFIAAPGVLANDYDLDGDAIVGASVQGANSAEVILNAVGWLKYTPDPAFVGTMSFEYQISDGSLLSNWATITVTVTAKPEPIAPVANDDVYTTPKNTPLVVSVPGVLVNDSSPAGHIFDTDDLTGEIVMNDSGDFVYTPAQGFVGTKTFHYTMTDGVMPSNSALVTITVTDPGEGTPGTDTPGTDIPGTDVPVTIADIPGESTTTAHDGSLASTGAATGWWVYPGTALLLAGIAALSFSRRRARR